MANIIPDQVDNNPDKEKAESYSPIQIAPRDGRMESDVQKEIVQDMVKMFQRYESWREPYEKLWEEIYQLYFSNQGRSKTPTRSLVTVPIVFQIIEAAVPKIVNSIFGSGEEFFDVIPTDPAEQEIADMIKLLLSYQLHQADFMVKFVDFCKQLLLYGTSYFFVHWKVRREWVYTRVPVRKMVTVDGFELGEQIEWKETKEYKVVERRPEVEVLDILDVFPDPEARTEKESKGIFVRNWKSLSEVKEMGKGKFPIFANTDSPELMGTAEDTFAESRQTRLAVRGLSSSRDNSKDQVELLTWWGCYDLDGDGIKEETQITVANRSQLFIARGLPFYHQKRPVIRTVFFPVPLEWYGMGLVEPIISNVHELWTLRRQRIDNINIIINRMWKVSSLADIDLDTLISSPNGIILTDIMDGVQPIETGDVTSSAYNEAATVQSDIENATAPRSVQGTPESGRLGRTAKGAQLIISQALEKFAVGTKLIEELGIKRVIRMFHQLNLQFIDSDDVLRDPGMYGHLFDAAISVENIRAEVRFKMVGISDMIGTEGKINQLISIFGTFAPYLQPQTIETILDKVVKLSGFDPAEFNIAAVANKLGALQGEPTNPEQNAILGQTQQNGAKSPKR